MKSAGKLLATMPIVDSSGRATQYFIDFLNLIINNVCISGTGSPEGVVKALIGKIYIDLADSPPSVYIKKSDSIDNDVTKGWILKV